MVALFVTFWQLKLIKMPSWLKETNADQWETKWLLVSNLNSLHNQTQLLPKGLYWDAPAMWMFSLKLGCEVDTISFTTITWATIFVVHS